MSESESMVKVILNDIVSKLSADSKYLASKTVDEVVKLRLESEKVPENLQKMYTRMDCYINTNGWL